MITHLAYFRFRVYNCSGIRGKTRISFTYIKSGKHTAYGWSFRIEQIKLVCHVWYYGDDCLRRCIRFDSTFVIQQYLAASVSILLYFKCRLKDRSYFWFFCIHAVGDLGVVVTSFTLLMVIVFLLFVLEEPSLIGSDRNIYVLCSFVESFRLCSSFRVIQVASLITKKESNRNISSTSIIRPTLAHRYQGTLPKHWKSSVPIEFWIEFGFDCGHASKTQNGITNCLFSQILSYVTVV